MGAGAAAGPPLHEPITDAAATTTPRPRTPDLQARGIRRLSPRDPFGPRMHDGTMTRSHSALSTRAVDVRAAMRPGMAATRFARTSAPTATSTTSVTGTEGSGTA